MIRILRVKKANEVSKLETKKEKAARRKQYWKKWRQEGRIGQEPEHEEEERGGEEEIKTAAVSTAKNRMEEYLARKQEMKRKKRTGDRKRRGRGVQEHQ